MRWDELYFGALAMLAGLAGSSSLYVGLSNGRVTVGVLELGTLDPRWQGLLLVFAGAFLLYGVIGGLAQQINQAYVVLGSLLLWILAGAEIVMTLLGVIPGGSDVWIAAPATIGTALLPPYGPGLIAGVLALVSLRYTAYWPANESTEPA